MAATVTDPTSPQAQEVLRVVKTGHTRRRVIWAIVLIVLIGLGVYAWSAQKRKAAEPTTRFVTEAVERGSLTLTASATGRLQPQRTVAIGAEVSGRIATVLVNSNDKVTKGQLLATFEKDTLTNAVDQAKLQLTTNQTAIRRSLANLADAKANEARTAQLAAGNAVAARELITVRNALTRANADLDEARARERLAKLSLDLSRTNLAKGEITSPIDGVVLKRSVEPGNTVAASLNSPELFQIAEDLSHMELHVSIDEADVGMVKPAQKAVFTVDAWPERTFEASVKLIQLAPTDAASNVVTYTAELAVENPDLLLRPGMTATATITTEQRDDILTIPAQSLRFQPQRDKSSGFSLFQAPRGARAGRTGGAGQQGVGGNAVWILRDGKPKRVPVKTGHTDGVRVEIREGLEAGDLIITAQESIKDEPEDAK
jgi:HlyD family secretion protein